MKEDIYASPKASLPGSPNDDDQIQHTMFRKLIVVAILLSAFLGIVTGLLRSQGLSSSALLYIGMPTILALAFAATPATKSVIGATLKAITFIILISGPLLQEGFICMLMAAPIFYVVGALVAWPFDYYRRKKAQKETISRINVMIIPSLFIVISMEGTSDKLTFERDNVISKTQVIERSIGDIRKTLASGRPLSAPNAVFAKFFPRPTWINANGLEIGNTQSVDITYFKWIAWNEDKGSTLFEVVENQPNFIRYQLKSDGSYIKSYLDWGESVVMFQPLSAERTQVTWRIHFLRKIDPAWYVQPIQRYIVEQVADTFLASLKP